MEFVTHILDADPATLGSTPRPLTQTLTQTLTLTLTLTRFRLLQWATALRVLPPGGLQGEAQRISRRGMLRAPPLYMYSA